MSVRAKKSAELLGNWRSVPARIQCVEYLISGVLYIILSVQSSCSAGWCTRRLHVDIVLRPTILYNILHTWLYTTVEWLQIWSLQHAKTRLWRPALGRFLDNAGHSHSCIIISRRSRSRWWVKRSWFHKQDSYSRERYSAANSWAVAVFMVRTSSVEDKELFSYLRRDRSRY